MANKILCDNAVNTYGPVLGLDELRESLASKWSRQYQGKVSKENVAVTSGCNQAFCASISSLPRKRRSNHSNSMVFQPPYVVTNGRCKKYTTRHRRQYESNN